MAPGAKISVGRAAGFLNTLSEHFSKQKDLPSPPPPPPISEQTAILCSILFTVLYVAPFYLSPTLRATPLSSRDAPSVIQARVRAVVFTCAACCTITALILIEYAHASTEELLHLTGFWPASIRDCANVLGLVAVLFVGPLYEGLIVDGDWRTISYTGIKTRLWDSWIGYRNLIVAPVSEELVFRSLTIPLFLIARVDPKRIVFVSPLLFGFAHLHHLAEFVKAHTPPGQRFPPAKAWISGVIRSLFQFTYTSLFGFFAAFVFLRTGSVWTAILAHSFCNSMGFPRIWGRVGQDEGFGHHTTPDVAQGKRDEDADGFARVGNAALLPDYEKTQGLRSQSRAHIGHSICYYVLLVGGAYGFYKLLWRLTESGHALASFEGHIDS